jgi:hypothetical protein
MQLAHPTLELDGEVFSKAALLANPNLLDKIVKLQCVKGKLIPGGSITILA